MDSAKTNCARDKALFYLTNIIVMTRTHWDPCTVNRRQRTVSIPRPNELRVIHNPICACPEPRLLTSDIVEQSQRIVSTIQKGKARGSFPFQNPVRVLAPDPRVHHDHIQLAGSNVMIHIYFFGLQSFFLYAIIRSQSIIHWYPHLLSTLLYPYSSVRSTTNGQCL